MLFASSTRVWLTLTAAVSVRADADHPWQAPSATDVRSPCPLLNALANHGWLPRSGRNITSEDVMMAVSASVNMDPEAAEFPAGLALTTSKTGNPETFDLHNLNEHGGESLHAP